MKKYNFDDLKKIMETLLGENGYPWEKAQTHESIAEIAKISRKSKLNAEIALTNYIEAFINRFEQEENAENL